jgi:hypothetical protein
MGLDDRWLDEETRPIKSASAAHNLASLSLGRFEGIEHCPHSAIMDERPDEHTFIPGISQG